MLKTAIALLLSGQSAEAAQDPAPLTPPSTWISRADYPKELRNVEGRTVAVLSVDSQGQVTACNIKVSSGSAVLDETVCRRAREHGRFTPSRDPHGVAINGSYVFPVLWGNPSIDVQPFSNRLVATMENGRATSCTTYDSSGAVIGEAHSRCNISKELLIRYFGQDYIRADRLTIESMTLPGHGPVPRGIADGRRVTLKESVITVGPDGRALTCQSRIPEAPKESFDDCLGFQTGRRFTGLAAFVRVTDWTLRYPPGDQGGAANK